MVLLLVLLVLSLSEIPDVLGVNQLMYLPSHHWPWHVSSFPYRLPDTGEALAVGTERLPGLWRGLIAGAA